MAGAHGRAKLGQTTGPDAAGDGLAAGRVGQGATEAVDESADLDADVVLALAASLGARPPAASPAPPRS